MSDSVDTPITDGFDIEAYLDALGVERAEPDLALLERLHQAHVRTLPFANVDVLLGCHPGVAAADVQRQLVENGRGGYCFEHTQLFAAALVDLGFDVTLRLGRVHAPTNSRTHLVTVVTLDGVRYLTDPGFGFSITGPLRLEDRATRDEGGRLFSIGAGTSGDVPTWTLLLDGKVVHIDDELPVTVADIRMGHHFTSTAPGSRFTSMLTVMRHTDDGHVTLTQSTRTVRRPGQPTEFSRIGLEEAVAGVVNLGVRLTADEQQRLVEILRTLGPVGGE